MTTNDPVARVPGYEMTTEDAAAVTRELIDEWSYTEDPHGFCHDRERYIALLAALDAQAAEIERLRWFALDVLAKRAVDALSECTCPMNDDGSLVNNPSCWYMLSLGDPERQRRIDAWITEAINGSA